MGVREAAERKAMRKESVIGTGGDKKCPEMGIFHRKLDLLTQGEKHRKQQILTHAHY